MRKIKLTQGQYALVSDHRYEELNQWKWYALWSKRTQSYYATRVVWDTPTKSRRIYMHRYIMGEPKSKIVDHLDHDTLNNTDENLRLASHSQNIMNRRAAKSSKLGLKNIHPSRVNNGKGRYYDYFTVQVRVGDQRRLKHFKKLDEAIAYRDDKLRELHGEYACGRGCA